MTQQALVLTTSVAQLVTAAVIAWSAIRTSRKTRQRRPGKSRSRRRSR